jgi:23S rRNA (guanosine2251-2'-O)-methyltransferase
MKRLVLIAHDIRLANNVGSLLRTADGLGVYKVFLTGYTPYPSKAGDRRLPHIQAKVARRIHKTALGAEDNLDWDYHEDLRSLIADLKADGFIMLALEQSPRATRLQDYSPKGRAALIVGNEVDGIDDDVLALCDKILMIPMAGHKESFNVAVAAGIALFHLKLS